MIKIKVKTRLEIDKLIEFLHYDNSLLILSNIERIKILNLINSYLNINEISIKQKSNGIGLETTIKIKRKSGNDIKQNVTDVSCW